MADNKKRGFNDSSSSSSPESFSQKFARRTPWYKPVVVYDLKRAKEVLEETTSLTHLFVSLNENEKTTAEIDREEIISMCLHQGIYLEEVSGTVYEFEFYEEAKRIVSDLQQKDDTTDLHMIIGPGPNASWKEGDQMEDLFNKYEYPYTRIPPRVSGSTYDAIVVYDVKKAKQVLQEKNSLTHMFLSLKETVSEIEEIKSICTHRGVLLEEVSGTVYEFESFDEAERIVSDLQQKDDKTNPHMIIGPDATWKDGDLMENLFNKYEYPYTWIPPRPRVSGSNQSK